MTKNKNEMELKDYKYLISSWQGLLQHLLTCVSKGYHYYLKIDIPLKKMDKVKSIDEKLIRKYNTNMSKDKRYYNKKKGFANFVYFRYENIAFVLMATDDFKGKETSSKIEIDDVFFAYNDKQNPLIFDVSSHLSFKINKNHKGKFTVFLAKKTFKDKRFVCYELIDKHLYKQAANEFNKLNGLPPFSGVIEQKLLLKKELVDYLRKHAKNKGLHLKNKKAQSNFRRNFIKEFSDSMYINMTRHPVRVFETNEDNKTF